MNTSDLSMEAITDLVRRIHWAQDVGADCSDLESQLISSVKFPHIRDLLDGDYSTEYVAEFLLGWRADWPRLTTQELIALVDRIINADGTDAEISLLIQQFDAHCVHPAKNGLIFYPEEYFENNPEPSSAQIVEKAQSAP